MQDLERRTASLKLELRASDEEGSQITGEAAVFDKWSGDLGGFRERIAPGAFQDVLKTSDTRALFNHDSNMLLGRQSSGTLRMEESKTGLGFTVDLGDTTVARDVREHISRGDIQGNSFAFRVEEDTWEKLDQDVAERTITKVGELLDVGPVTFPAYEDTTVSVRALNMAKKETRGASLGTLLKSLIDEQAEDEGMTVEEVQSAAGSAAGISGSTVGQIAAGSIDCPPLNRLRGLARYFGVSLGRLRGAAESDGCEYDSNGRSSCQNWVEPLSEAEARQKRAELTV